MYKIEIPISNKIYNGWTIGDEKEFLMNRSDTEDTEVILNEMYLYLLKDEEGHKYSINEKLYTLSIMKSYLYGDLVEVRYFCQHCNKDTEGAYSITNALKYTQPPKVIKLGDYVFHIHKNGDTVENSISKIENTDKSIEEVVDEELTIKEYNILRDLVNKTKEGETLEIEAEIPCLLCGASTFSKIDKDERIKNFIPNTIKDIYNIELNMKLKGNFTLQEVRSMYPYEVLVYSDLISAKMKGE